MVIHGTGCSGVMFDARCGAVPGEHHEKLEKLHISLYCCQCVVPGRELGKRRRGSYQPKLVSRSQMSVFTLQKLSPLALRFSVPSWQHLRITYGAQGTTCRDLTD